MGNVLYNQGQHDQAMEAYTTSLNIELDVYGSGHPNLACTYGNIGNIHSSANRFDEAMKQYHKALAIQLAALGPNHPHVAAMHSNMGNVLGNQGKYDAAIEQYQTCLAIELAVAPNHPNAARVCSKIGRVLYFQQKYQEAAEQIQQCLAIQLAAPEPNNAAIETTREELRQLEVLCDTGAETDLLLLSEQGAKDLLECLQETGGTVVGAQAKRQKTNGVVGTAAMLASALNNDAGLQAEKEAPVP